MFAVEFEVLFVAVAACTAVVEIAGSFGNNIVGTFEAAYTFDTGNYMDTASVVD